MATHPEQLRSRGPHDEHVEREVDHLGEELQRCEQQALAVRSGLPGHAMREEGCWQGQQLVNCIGPPPTSERIARPAPPPADEEGIARRLCQNVRHALKSSEAFANVFDTNALSI